MFSHVVAACLIIAFLYYLTYTVQFIRSELIVCIQNSPHYMRGQLETFLKILEELQGALEIGYKLSVYILVIHVCVEVIRFQIDLAATISYVLDNKAEYVYEVLHQMAVWIPALGRCVAWTLILILECMSSVLRFLLQ